MYDTHHHLIPPGAQGYCHALPPIEDNRWPLTMGVQGCGCHEPLEEASPPGANAGRATGEAPATASGDPLAEGADSDANPKPAQALAPSRPPSLLERILPGRGHGRSSGRQ